MDQKGINKRILAQLDNHEKRIRALEGPAAKSSRTAKNSSHFSTTKTLKDYILDLKSKNFFKEPRTVEETHKKLEGTYRCERKRVGVELIRLHRKKQLRKTSRIVGKKRVIAYVW